MTNERYPQEVLDNEYEDDGTMPENVAELEKAHIDDVRIFTGTVQS